MKPQLVAKRNAEIRRRAEEARLALEPPMAERPAPSPGIGWFIPGLRAFWSVVRVPARYLAATLMMALGGGVTYYAVRYAWGTLALMARAGAGTIGFQLVFVLILLIPAAVFVIFLFQTALGLIRSARWQQVSGPVMRTLETLAYDAEPVTGYTIGIENEIFTYQVLICFDDTPSGQGLTSSKDQEAMYVAAVRIGESDWFQQALADKPFVADRRLVVPPELSGGRPMYVADLIVRHPRSDKVASVRRTVFCIAERGANGRIAPADAGRNRY